MRVPSVVAYDDEWPGWFERERAALGPLVERWATTPLEHIGSTAIPGMPAKPVLDLMLGVADLVSAAALADHLSNHGWQRRPHRVDAELVVRVRDGLDDAHLHLTTPTSDLWRERIAFRDALRGNATLAAEYAGLKRQLLAANGGRPYRGADKQEFVQRVLTSAGIELRGDRHVMPR